MSDTPLHALVGRSFLKMNGLGNDFLVFDARREPIDLLEDQVRTLADRDGPFGCDQVIVVERSDQADARMRTWNADGGEVETCGNAARCVGWIVMDDAGADEASIETRGGHLHARRAGSLLVSVDMGAPRFDWTEIPLAKPVDTNGFVVSEAEMHGLGAAHAVNVGNPHVVFEVADVDRVAVRTAGAAIETASLFPQRVNVGFAEVRGPDALRLRVWERGAGLTKACGTGACAAVAALYRAGRVSRWVQVGLDGGSLEIYLATGGRLLMTGAVSIEGVGRIGEGL